MRAPIRQRLLVGVQEQEQARGPVQKLQPQRVALPPRPGLGGPPKAGKAATEQWLRGTGCWVSRLQARQSGTRTPPPEPVTWLAPAPAPALALAMASGAEPVQLQTPEGALVPPQADAPVQEPAPTRQRALASQARFPARGRVAAVAASPPLSLTLGAGSPATGGQWRCLESAASAGPGPQAGQTAETLP